MGFLVRTLLVVGVIYALSPVETGPSPDLRALADKAAGGLPAATGTVSRDAAAAALAACAARPQACADMAATLRSTTHPDKPAR